MYKTGDLGKWRTDGSKLLDIMGRVDDQVKIKGFRVELDGVAAAIEVSSPDETVHARTNVERMESVPGVHSGAALLVDDELVGIYAPEEIDEACIRSACAKIQPYYACPTRYIKLREMPTTVNG